MSDQCKHCILLGDLTECEKESCYHHDAWYVQTILARHTALVEAVAWLREVDDTREWLSEFPWLRKWSGLDQCMNVARAEVDRLIATDDCKGEG